MALQTPLYYDSSEKRMDKSKDSVKLVWYGLQVWNDSHHNVEHRKVIFGGTKKKQILTEYIIFVFVKKIVAGTPAFEC
jgi:hypothetical protein